MTDLDSIRSRHTQRGQVCSLCGLGWPCDAIQAADNAISLKKRLDTAWERHDEDGQRHIEQWARIRRLLNMLRAAQRVIGYVSTGRSFVDVEPYPDATARRVGAQIADLLEKFAPQDLNIGTEADEPTTDPMLQTKLGVSPTDRSPR